MTPVVDTRQLEGQSDLGFAGFRVFKAPELARRDIVAFLGASYFPRGRQHLSVWPVGPRSGGGYLYRYPGRVSRLYVVLVRNGQRGRHGVYRFTHAAGAARASLAPTSSPSTARIPRLSWTWKTTWYARKDIQTAGYRADNAVCSAAAIMSGG